MIRKIVYVLVSILLISTMLYPVGCSQDKALETEMDDTLVPSYIPGTYLIQTQWGQHGEYKVLCPWYYDHEDEDPKWKHCRLGCWSIALAQIIRYYQLQSQGLINYKCSLNILSYPIRVFPNKVKTNLYAHTYNWSLMPNNLTSTSSPDEKEMTSQFVFDVACVIQKDFGTGKYKTLGDPFNPNGLMTALDIHFIGIDSLIWVENLTPMHIQGQIDQFHPIMFYIRNTSALDGTKEYHAVVLDGYRWNVGTFEVHLNYGWDGDNPDLPSQSWYAYDSKLPEYPDRYFRKGMLFIAEPIPQIFGTITAVPGVPEDFQAVTINNSVSSMYYQWDWDDGNVSSWMGRYISGEMCIAEHSWNMHGIYSVKVKASDLDTWETPWSQPHIVYIPRLRVFISFVELLVDIMTRFPRLDPIIKPILTLIC